MLCSFFNQVSAWLQKFRRHLFFLPRISEAQRATKKRLPEVAQLLREFSGSGGKAGFSRSPQDVLRNEAHQS
jgi:hypothetical protein